VSCDFQPLPRSFRPAFPPIRLLTGHAASSPNFPASLPACFINPRVTSYKISRRPSPFCSASYKILFQQLLCFENDPSFMGGVCTCVCTPLKEEIMNSTIASSSSTIDIPAVTSRDDSSLPHAPKEGRCQHLFPNGKRCRKFASGSHLGLCLQRLTESAAIGAGLQQPPNDSQSLEGTMEGKCSKLHRPPPPSPLAWPQAGS